MKAHGYIHDVYFNDMMIIIALIFSRTKLPTLIKNKILEPNL